MAQVVAVHIRHIASADMFRWQKNGTDCGVFVCMFLERFLCPGHGLRGLSSKIAEDANTALNYRGSMRALLLDHLQSTEQDVAV